MSAQTVLGAPKAAGRNPYLDSLKLAMSFMVICIHTNFAAGWWSSITFDYFTSGLCRIAVPVFLIINGFFYSNKGFQRTLKTVFKLYCLWTLLYMPFWFLSLATTEDLTRVDLVSEIIITLVCGYYHLWYLNGLIVALVLFHVFLRDATPGRILLTAVVLYCIAAGLQYFFTYKTEIWSPDTTGRDLLLHTYRNAILLALPYFCLGVFFKRSNVLTQTSPWLIRLLLLLSCGLFAVELWSKDHFLSEFNQDLYFSLVLVSPLMFAFCYQLPWRKGFHTPLVGELATRVFLIHPAIMFSLYYLYGVKPTVPVILMSVTISLIWYYAQRSWQQHHHRLATS